jgi:drug/metabolite transporter (DMT)-like permease
MMIRPTRGDKSGMQERRQNVGAALLLALTGFSILSVGDGIVKTMAGEWPGPAVSALRYSFGTIGLAAVVALRFGRAGFVLPKPGLQLGRGAAVALATACFFVAAMAMPLADATAIQFISPMITALLAPFVLGERTPRAAFVAIALAFAGVLIVLRPNVLALGAEALYPLGAAFGMAWLMIFNRKAAGVAPVLVMQLLLALFATPLLIAAALLLSRLPQFAVTWPSAEVVIKCATIAFTATTGHLLIYTATMRATAALVAPMTYVQLLVAGAIGWWWFGDAPDSTTVAGAALIIAGGLWLWRSQKTPDVAETPD